MATKSPVPSWLYDVTNVVLPTVVDFLTTLPWTS